MSDKPVVVRKVVSARPTTDGEAVVIGLMDSTGDIESIGINHANILEAVVRLLGAASQAADRRPPTPNGASQNCVTPIDLSVGTTEEGLVVVTFFPVPNVPLMFALPREAAARLAQGVSDAIPIAAPRTVN